MQKKLLSRIFLIVPAAIIFILVAFYFKEQEKASIYPDKIEGFNLVAPRTSISIDSLLKVKATGAEWVGIVPYAFCNASTGEIFFDRERQWWGERPAGIIESIQKARSIGLKVMLKPHLWVGGQGWAGDLTFESDSIWNIFEQDYMKYLATFTKIADSMQVEMLCIGTEIRSSTKQRPDFWKKLISQIRNDYSGALTYAANWDEYDQINFWSELDYIGIDAYFPLSAQKNPDKETLVQNWATPIAEMRTVATKYDKPILFTEYGYESVDYSTAGHWNINKDTLSVNLAAQRIAFDALYTALNKEPWWRGGFIWKWHLTQNGLQKRTIKAYTPQDKPALELIKKEFKPNFN